MSCVLIGRFWSGRRLGARELFELALDGHHRRALVEAGELREADLGQRAADRRVEPLPRPADLATVLEATISTADGTIRQRERSFQCVENGRGADSVRRPGQLISAARSARGIDQAGAMQLFE